MHNSKLIRFLQSLEREEFRAFGQFLRSPYFNSSEQLLALYDLLHDHYPGLFSPKLAKEKAFAQLFPGKPYDDSRMRQLMYKMTRLLEDFLVAQEIRHAKVHRNQLLTEALGRRKLHLDFQRSVQQEIKQLESKKCKDLRSIGRLLHYNHQYFFHPDTSKFKKGVQSIRDCMTHLDHYFSLAKLQYASELMTRSATLGEQHQMWLLEEVLAQTEKPSNVLLELYDGLIRLYQNREDESLFHQLRARFVDLIDQLPQQERIELYQQLSNYAVAQINKGDRRYLHDFLELTKVALTYDILLDKNRITDATFTNVAAIAAALKVFDWTAEFIANYEKKLAPNVRESATQLAWAYLYYHKGAFEKVLDCLVEVSFLPSYVFRVKSLRLRTYFELFRQQPSYHEVLLSDLHAFETYIRRGSGMNAQRQTTYLNFILYTKKLIKLLTNPKRTSSDKEALRESIRQKEPMVVKHWLLEKIKEL